MPETMTGLESLDAEKLASEVAKVVDEDTTPDPTTEKEPQKEETSEETSPRTETSLKTEEEPEDTGKAGDEDRFDKHPRFIKLRTERDEAKTRYEEAQAGLVKLQELETQLGGFTPDEMKRLQEAGTYLKKYPALAEKVQELLDNYQYGDEKVKTEIDTVRQRQDKLESDLALEKYDAILDKFISQHKIDKDVEPLVREMVDNRVILNKAKLGDISKIFDKTLKDIEIFRRKTIASYTDDKNNTPKVPKTTTQRDKVIVAKQESEDIEDVIANFTDGLKKASSTG